MSVHIVNLDKVNFRLGQLQDVFKRTKAFKEVGQFAVFRIKERTSRGVDVDNRPFIPYSLSYKFWRTKHGFPTDKVDLMLSGGMMNAMTYEVDSTAKQVRVFFMPGTSRRVRGQRKRPKVQHPAKAFYLQKKRRFFAMSDKDVGKIRDIFSDSIRRSVEGGAQ